MPCHGHALATNAVVVATLLLSRPVFADLDISALLKQQRSGSGTQSSAPALQLPSPKIAPAANATVTPKENAGTAGSHFRNAVALDTPSPTEDGLLRAADLYRKAAELGHTKAQTALGLMFAQGHGVKSDDERAAFWLSKAAASGNALAQYSLGLLYYEGRGIEQDYSQAISLYRNAASNGNAKAMNNLGIMHALGHGVSEHNPTALAWFSLATQAGSQDAKSNAELLRQELTGPEISKSEQIELRLRNEL